MCLYPVIVVDFFGDVALSLDLIHSATESRDFSGFIIKTETYKYIISPLEWKKEMLEGGTIHHVQYSLYDKEHEMVERIIRIKRKSQCSIHSRWREQNGAS